MNIGKLPNDILEKLILNDIVTRRDETVLRPAVGEDCCALDLGNNLCVISTDPITAADENAGILAVLVSLNDLAASGAEPVGILTTVLLPPGTTEKKTRNLFKMINETCASMNVDVLGGHTEVTDSVNRVVIITTAIGKVTKGGLIRSDGVQSGDAILMTKAAGLEGTAIISSDKNDELFEYMTLEELSKGRQYIKEISVVNEGIVAAANGAHAMHDITEGGVFGAIWEICRASGYGANIYIDKIPVRDITRKICSYYNLSVYKLISSGSMLITCSQNNKDRIVKMIQDLGIECTEIGIIDKSGIVYAINKDEKNVVDQPDTDELYKVI